MKLTKKEVKELIDVEVERIEGEDRRWSRTNISIVKIKDKFYEIYWEQGLTENQDNEFEDQEAVEVIQKKRTIVEKFWEKL